jgi:hypothetical protein
MSFALTVFNESVDRLTQDAAEVLDSADVDGLVKQALQRYSHDAPDEDVVEITGDGGQYYAISNLTAWSEGFSKIRAVEYPAATVASDEQPQMLESKDYAVFEDATAKYIYFPNHSPSSTEKIRVWYTVPYTFSGTPAAADVPAEDFYAVCLLAASYCCDALATYYATHVDVGDGRLDVKRDKVSAKYEERAKKYEQAYLKHMGLPLDGRPRAASVFGEWDVYPNGREYVHHPSYRR